MKRLALPAWLAGLLVLTAWLHALPTNGDATFAAARAFAVSGAAYLLLATVVTIGLAMCRVWVRLPLVPLLVVASLGTPLVGTPAFATSPTPTAASAPPVMHRIGDRLAPAPSTPAPAPAPAHAAPPATAPAPAAAPATTWTVRHGQCLWSIAAHVIGVRLARTPTNAEIVPYWRRLIEVNRTRLAHPNDPGLLFAGQELVLPPD